MGSQLLQVPVGTLIRTGDTLRIYNVTLGSDRRWDVGPAAVDYTASGAAADVGITWPTEILMTSNKIHNVANPGQPIRDDELFVAGDFIVNSKGAGYGPYVEGQVTDILAWPVAWAAPAATTPVDLVDTVRSNTYRLGINDGNLYVEEQ